MNQEKLSHPNYTYEQLKLMNTMRKLWEQHVLWTRSFIISTAEHLQDLDPVTKRLLRNPQDFANILYVYYGAQAAQEFKDLLTKHLLIAADLINSAAKGDNAKTAQARMQWYENADQIALFLSRINPYWNRSKWQNLLYEHLQMTEKEAVQRLNKQYANDIQSYDEIENEALKMADYMALGMIRQFMI